MNNNIFDLQSARTLFSKAQRVSFGFLNRAETKTPFISLIFRSEENKLAQFVLYQLSKTLKDSLLKLYVNENGGDFLSVSFLWESRGIIFSSSPDRYNKRECRDFRLNVLYGDIVKLFFYIDVDGKEVAVKDKEKGMEISGINSVYHEYTS
jgi:hypothetical protein